MKTWVFFITLSLLIGFGNEWAKLNINFFSDLTSREDWDEWNFSQKHAAFQRHVELTDEAYYFQIVKWEFLLVWNNERWSILKWIIPISTTVIFFILEIVFLPKLFYSMKISRSHIRYYYGLILLLVGVFFIFFKWFSMVEFLNISRKLWVLLQGPSLFIILWMYQLIHKNELSNH